MSINSHHHRSRHIHNQDNKAHQHQSKTPHLGQIMLTLPKNYHLHQCNEYHSHTRDSTLHHQLHIPHKLDKSYSTSNINQYQSEHTNYNSNNLANGNIFHIQKVSNNQKNACKADVCNNTCSAHLPACTIDKYIADFKANQHQCQYD